MAVKMPPTVQPAKAEDAADAFIEKRGRPAAPAPAAEPERPGKAVVNLRMDNALLNRIDREARKVGISRSAWLHTAAYEKLERQ
jgi:predicted HicB family RNase H-like nuclease